MARFYTSRRVAKRRAHRAYHIVNRRQLFAGHANGILCAKEFDQRVQYTKEYYNNMYDDGHKKFMCILARNIGLDAKLSMSLDACVIMSKVCKRY